MTDAPIPHSTLPLPPPLHTSEAGSFARFTIAQRKPDILAQVLADHDWPPTVAAALRAFADELVSAPVQPLAGDVPDADDWHARWQAHAGAPWLALPWYFAEAFFYARLLDITGYDRPGAGHRRDPFAPAKVRELARQWDGIRQLAAQAAAVPDDADGAARHFERLLHFALWGNRADLSNRAVSDARGAQAAQLEHANLLVDDAAAFIADWGTQTRPRVAFINDNAGIELAADLALADFLLRTQRAEQVVFHLKPSPFFVSDAMPEDAAALVLRLAEDSDAATRALGQRLVACLDMGWLRWQTHPFWVSAGMYWQMPPDLHAAIAGASVVFLKGDVNYRRLLGDRHWPHDTPLAAIARYFPTDAVVLRTLKSEIAVGLQPGEAEALAARDPEWLLSGQRGVIHWLRRAA